MIVKILGFAPPLSVKIVFLLWWELLSCKEGDSIVKYSGVLPVFPPLSRDTYCLHFIRASSAASLLFSFLLSLTCSVFENNSALAAEEISSCSLGQASFTYAQGQFSNFFSSLFQSISTELCQLESCQSARKASHRKLLPTGSPHYITNSSLYLY